MQHRPTVLILGARGRFGAAAVTAFAEAGWQVLAQCRPGRSGPSRSGVCWLPLAPDDTPPLAAAARGATVVVHGLSPLYTHRAWRREVPRLTRAAIDIGRALGATLMLPASVYNFGESMPPQLLEDTPHAARGFKGRLRIESEQAIRAATADGGMRAVVIRAGDFFGSGTGSWLDQVLAKDLAKGRFTYPGQLDVPTAWAYLPDLARAFVAVAREAGSLQPFENLHFAGHALTGADWQRALEAAARQRGWLSDSKPLQVRFLPWRLLGLAGLVMPTLAALHDMRYLWRTPHSLVNRRMTALVGPEPRTPLEAAVDAALDNITQPSTAARLQPA